MTGGDAIRLATADDAGFIAAMLAQLAEDLGDEDFASTTQTIRQHGFGPDPAFRTMIAGNADQPAGMALFFPHFSTTRGQPGVFVQDLWFDPSARRKGLARRLLSAVSAHASRVWGAAYLILNVHLDNARAGQFYRPLGFSPHPEDVPMSVSGPDFTSLAEGGA